MQLPLILLGISCLIANFVSAQDMGITGYFTVNQSQNGNLFYWIFESQSDPDTDPVVLWVSGGPGCSGGLASFYENGPYTVDANLNLVKNPYSWNTIATVIYIDQPVQVGYSYANTPYVVDEAGVARDMRTFFKLFFARYPSYLARPFFISGESYGGKYVPTMATVILELNKYEMRANPIPLQGISIGNGIVNPLIQDPLQAYAAFQAGVVTSKQYQELQKSSLVCKNLIQQKLWSNASDVCNEIMIQMLKYAGDINPTNYKQHCPIQDCFVYDNITNYLNQNSVKTQLGVPLGVTWQTCNFNIQFTDEDQMNALSNVQISKILDSSNVRVLIYYGDLDLVCPYEGGIAWMLQTPWHGQNGFRVAPTKKWTNGNTLYGWSQSYANFTYVRVANAGHMAPHDQPVPSLQLFANFLGNIPFGQQ